MAQGRRGGRRLIVRPTGIDWDDDASIEVWAHRVWTQFTMGGQEPMNDQTTILTDRFSAAVAYAQAIHATQLRKGTTVPYLAHLLGVASLVLEAGGSEDEVIAGLLHDAVEDCGGLPRLADVRARFGDTVADIVLACSDSTDQEFRRVTPYLVRKRAYLEHLEAADHRAVTVSIADKAHNARSLVTDLQRHGPTVIDKFNGTPAQILGYYRECLRIGEAKGVSDAVLCPLRTALAEITAYVEG